MYGDFKKEFDKTWYCVKKFIGDFRHSVDSISILLKLNPFQNMGDAH